MKQAPKIIPLFLLLITHNASHAVTLVYNLRVRRIFAVAAVLERMKSRTLATAVPIYFTRSRPLLEERTNLNGCEKRRAGGALINLRHVPSKHWWIGATTAIATDHGTFTGSDPFHASRTGLDDIVFTAGYRHFVGDKAQLVAYGLAGIPTRHKLTLEDRHTPLLGTRFYNLGIGGELSYSFLSELKRSFATIAQVRFIHGFNRSWCPVLPAGSTFQPGNSIDMLFTAQYRKKRTVIEGGYDGTFFANQAIITPVETIKTDTVYRHTGYLSLSHASFETFLRKPIVYGAGFNASYAPRIDTKTFSFWIHGSIVF